MLFKWHDLKIKRFRNKITDDVPRFRIVTNILLNEQFVTNCIFHILLMQSWVIVVNLNSTVENFERFWASKF